MRQLATILILLTTMLTCAPAKETTETASLITLRIKTTETKWKKDDGDHVSTQGRKTKKTNYELTLQNESQANFSDVRAEYCIYREREQKGKEDYIQVIAKKEPLEALNASETKTISLGNPMSFEISKNGFLNEVVGVRVKIYFSDNEDADIVKEISYPSSLSARRFPWQAPETSE